jgi:hypothetical protein
MTDETMDEVIERIRARQDAEYAAQQESEAEHLRSLIGATIVEVEDTDEGLRLTLDTGATLHAE